jgi:hypothetical protein
MISTTPVSRPTNCGLRVGTDPAEGATRFFCARAGNREEGDHIDAAQPRALSNFCPMLIYNPLALQRSVFTMAITARQIRPSNSIPVLLFLGEKRLRPVATHFAQPSSPAPA